MPTAEPKSRFVCRLPLAPTASQRVELLTRMRQARKWYNVVLKECITRVSHIKANRVYQDICAARRASAKTEQAAFRTPLQAIQSNIPGLSGKSFVGWYSLEKELRALGKTIAPRLGAQSRNTIGERAFDTAAKWLYGGDRPRYRKGHEFVSVNGNQQITIHNEAKGKYVRWNGLEVSVWFRDGDEHVEYSLSHDIACIEIVYNGDTFAAHLICKGSPRGVPALPGVTVGVDPGISEIAAVSPTYAVKFPLRVTSAGRRAHLRRLQRHAQRQADVAKASKKRSKSLRQTRRAIARLQRQEATTNKQATNAVAKAIVALGASINLEKPLAKQWQAMYGKRMQSTRPGALAARLRQLADVTDIDCATHALSQMCICGRRVKKPLSQRVHSCPCGVVADRDLWSAYLALHVVAGKLDLGVAKADYPTAQSRLSPRNRVQSSTDSASTGYARGAVALLTSEVLADVNPGNPDTKLGKGRGRKTGGTRLVKVLEVDRVTIDDASVNSG